jgi:arylsulfatase A-like enzyme
LNARARILLTLGALGLAAPSGCRPTPVEVVPPPNVLFVVVDTLGARYVSVHNQEVTFTSQLERLEQRDTVVFSRAHTVAPWTKPSVASMFTGVYPSEHGLTDLNHRFTPPVATLASVLGEHGFATKGVVSHTLLNKGVGFGEGFESYEMVLLKANPHEAISSQDVTDSALAWLEAREGQPDEAEPFFLFVHYFDPHYAYHHHEEFDRSSWYQGDISSGTDFEVLFDRTRAGELSDDDLGYLRNLYEEEVAYTDGQIGRLLDGLQAQGLLEDTLVVFVGDHGEEFGEHGSLGHTKSLYGELVDVPYLVSFPGPARVRLVDEVVSLIDLMPTLLDLYGLPAPQPMSGRSLKSLLADPDARLQRDGVFAEVSFTPERRRAMKVAKIEAGAKLVYDLDADAWEFYDLARDPLEQEDAYDADDPRQARMRRDLERFRALVQQRAEGAPDAGQLLELDGAQLDALKKLGY